MSFRHLLLLFLFLLFLHALAFIFSVTRSFSLPEFSFFQSGTSPWHELCYSAVVLRRSAWSRSSRFGRAALFCVAWVCADARVVRSCSMGGLALRYPRPSSLYFEMYRSASMLPVIDLAPRGEDGMVASVEETESSASSTSSGRHSAGLPIVGPPRGLFATGLSWRKILFRFFARICNCIPLITP